MTFVHRIFSHILYQCVVLITATIGATIFFAETQIIPQPNASKTEAAYIFYTLGAHRNEIFILI